MTNKDSILNHLVWIASDQPTRPGDKAYAWAEAKRYGALLPDWADLPELLAARMKALAPARAHLEGKP
jgi:hypothetical protein